MSEPYAIRDGDFIPYSQAALPLHDAGIVHGACVSSYCRTIQHRPFRLKDHVARFLHDCGYAQIGEPATSSALEEWGQRLVERNAALLPDSQELALIFLATPGPMSVYLGLPEGTSRPTLFMHTFPIPFARYRPLFQEGARLTIPSTRQLPSQCIDPRVKQRSRLHWWRADREAKLIEPGSLALLLDTDGYVAETALATFLIAREGMLVMPPHELILNSISLKVSIEICGQLGIPIREERLTLSACQAADEAMLTGTAFGLAGVRSIQRKMLPWPGPITQRLLAGWNALTGLDLAAQILAGG